MHATLFTDPACPWGYSANPDLTALRWRYGDGISWKVAMIGLAESPQRYIDIGYTPERMVKGHRDFARRFGMPFSREPRDRVAATGFVCRAVVATRLVDPAREWAAVRALQFAWFCGPEVLDSEAAVADALKLVEGLDIDAVLTQLADPATEAAYQRDRAQARTAAGSATEYQGKSANSDGAERFTAPSVVFSTGTGVTLEAGGFQSLAVYDAIIANLDRTLPRRGPAQSPLQVLEAFPDGVTTQEIALLLAPSLTEPDRAGTEDQLLDLLGERKVRRTHLGDDALWRLP
jgi:protein-disulfide isomerase-like protein with CxxC motif